MSEAPCVHRYPVTTFAPAPISGLPTTRRTTSAPGLHPRRGRQDPLWPPAARPPSGCCCRWGRRLRFFFAVLRARPSFALGYAIVVGVIVIAALAPWIVPFDPMTADPAVYLLPPGGRHLLGTDGAGMDIFSRVLYAPRVDLTIAVTGTLVSAVIGGAIGAVVGYYEGQRAWRRALSTFVMRSADVLQAFPVFVFAIALVAVFGQSVKSIVIAIAFVNVPIYLRLTRSQVLSIRQLRYVEAAYVAGASDLAILWRHVIPNALAPLVAQLSIKSAGRCF